MTELEDDEADLAETRDDDDRWTVTRAAAVLL